MIKYQGNYLILYFNLGKVIQIIYLLSLLPLSARRLSKELTKSNREKDGSNIWLLETITGHQNKKVFPV
jgi:hypothetical protein